jgi:hypothetical protein
MRAELEVPALTEAVRRILKAEAQRLGVPLDPAEVLVRRAADGTEMHIMAPGTNSSSTCWPPRRSRSAKKARSWSGACWR